MFFKRKTPLSQDQLDIQNSIVLLNVSEYRLLELAYEEWFGMSATESELELAYIGYLFGMGIPCWVRQYVRNIRRLSDEAGVRGDTSGLAQSRKFSYAASGKISAPTFALTLLLSMLIAIL